MNGERALRAPGSWDRAGRGHRLRERDHPRQRPRARRPGDAAGPCPTRCPAGDVAVALARVTALAEPSSVRAALPEGSGALPSPSAPRVVPAGGPSRARVSRRLVRCGPGPAPQRGARAAPPSTAGSFLPTRARPGLRARRPPGDARGGGPLWPRPSPPTRCSPGSSPTLDVRARSTSTSGPAAPPDLAAEELRDAQACAAERVGEGTDAHRHRPPDGRRAALWSTSPTRWPRRAGGRCTRLASATRGGTRRGSRRGPWWRSDRARTGAASASRSPPPTCSSTRGSPSSRRSASGARSRRRRRATVAPPGLDRMF